MADEIMNTLKRDIKRNRLKMWEVAKEAGITDGTLSVWMRSYNPDHYQRISKAIDRLTERGKNDE